MSFYWERPSVMPFNLVTLSCCLLGWVLLVGSCCAERLQFTYGGTLSHNSQQADINDDSDATKTALLTLEVLWDDTWSTFGGLAIPIGRHAYIENNRSVEQDQQTMVLIGQEVGYHLYRWHQMTSKLKLGLIASTVEKQLQGSTSMRLEINFPQGLTMFSGFMWTPDTHTQTLFYGLGHGF